MTDLTQPVQTRNGRAARIVTTAYNGGDYTVGAIVTAPDGKENFETYTAEGLYSVLKGDGEALDLVNPPETFTVFVNLGSAHVEQADAAQRFPSWPVLKVVRDRADMTLLSSEIIPALNS